MCSSSEDTRTRLPDIKGTKNVQISKCDQPRADARLGKREVAVRMPAKATIIRDGFK